MSDRSTGIAAAWEQPNVIEFFERARSTTEDVYPSEWLLLQNVLREEMSVLDIGCAQGGFAQIIAEHVKSFHYTGVDISAEMVGRARRRFPQHRFFHTPDGNFSPLGGERFDVVLALGILHLHDGWRQTISRGWERTKHSFLFDLRESDGATIEDVRTSYLRMDFNAGSPQSSSVVLPYIVVNAADALSEVRRQCGGAHHISRYGYLHDVSQSAVTPVSAVMTTVWRVDR